MKRWPIIVGMSCLLCMVLGLGLGCQERECLGGGAAKELHDLLESRGVSVWFSEKDVLLGSSLLREIDKGLAKSRVGIVLVTPSFLSRVRGEGIADKELSALLARDLLVPIVHNT